jgi:hypothetical protein
MGTLELAETPSRQQLPESEMKQQFSIAFVHMVASAAGCSTKVHSTDYDGVDITISSSIEYEKFTGSEIELQIKCTAQQNLLTNEAMTWVLDAKPFRKLTDPRTYVPRFLAVLLVPNKSSLWLEQDEAGLLTESRMYWERASMLGSIPGTQHSKTVHLPRKNLFDVDQLQVIMKKIGDGGVW